MGGQSRESGSALRRSGWRRAHDAFGGGAYAGPRQQLGSRHAIPGRHARRERRSCPLLFSAATSIGKQESLPRIHLWTMARRWDSPAPALVHLEGFTAGSGQPGLNRGRGRPGSPLQAAGRGRAQPPKPTHADRQVGLTWRAGRENFLPVGLTGQVGLSLPPGPGVGLRFRGGAAAASGSEYRDPLKTLNPKP